MTTKRHISYPDGLNDAIVRLEKAGYIETHSQFFQEAAMSHLMLLSIASQTFETTLPDDFDEDDVRTLIEEINTIDSNL